MKYSRIKKSIVVWSIALNFIFSPLGVRGEPAETLENSNQTLIEAPGAVLMEKETGTVIYSRDPDTKRSPASITKIMTLILIFDAIRDGRLHLDDTITTSAYAKSMGGFQVYLEEGETQKAETMIKCIVIASGNDASVAMAEHLAGSESAFVDMMNEKAKEIGATNTHFVNCHGLHDDAHYTTAYDLYLIIKEFSKHDLAYVIDSLDTYDFTYTDADGNEQVVTIEPTNEFLTGEVNFPDGYSKGTWKTGTTEEALNCLIMELKNDSTGEEYIALVAGADGKEALYSAMTELINKAK